MSQGSHRKLFITCQEATYLISKDEVWATGLLDKLKLAVHLMICEFCRRFSKQTKIIERQARHLTPEARLSEEEKGLMEEAIKTKENGLQ